MELDDGGFVLADFTWLPGHHSIAFVPQWDLLEMLAREGGRWPGFELRRSTEVIDLLRDGERVRGVRVRNGAGTEEIGARLTIAADGRGSALRARAGLPLRTIGAPIDVLWFRLPPAGGDPEGSPLRLSAGMLAVLLRREEYWQCAFVVRKGTADSLLADDAEPLRRRFGEALPAFAGRVADLPAGDVRVLDVRLDRLERWWQPGLLCIGDCAHAMSPVGGVGINLAVQDAVATANLLAEPLHAGADVDDLLPPGAGAPQPAHRADPAAAGGGARPAAHAVGARCGASGAPAGAAAAAPPGTGARASVRLVHRHRGAPGAGPLPGRGGPALTLSCGRRPGWRARRSPRSPPRPAGRRASARPRPASR